MDTSSTFLEILRQPLLAEEVFNNLTWKDLINIRNTNSVFQHAIHTYVSHLKTVDLNSHEFMELDNPQVIMDCTRNLRKLAVKTILKKVNASKGKLSVTDLVNVVNRNELLVELDELRMDLIPFVGDSLKSIHKLSLYQDDDNELHDEEYQKKFLGYCKYLVDNCKSLHELAELKVESYDLTDEQFRLICKLPVKSLVLTVDFEVEDFDSCLSNCPLLESIDMFECSGDRDILPAIARNCRNLTAFKYFQYNVSTDHDEASLTKCFTKMIQSNPKMSIFRAETEEEISTCNSATMDAMVHNLQALEQISVTLYERNLLAVQPSFFRLVSKFSMLKRIDIICFYFPQKWVDHIAQSCSSLEEFGVYDTDDSSMQFPEENRQAENQDEQNQPEQNAEENQQEQNAEENSDRGVEKKRRLRREKRRRQRMRQRMKIKEQNRKKQNGEEESLPQHNCEEQEAIEQKRQARREKRRKQRRRRRERNQQEQDAQENSQQRSFQGNRREQNAQEKKRQRRREKRRRQRKRRRERKEQERNEQDANLPQQNANDGNPQEQNVEDDSDETRYNELNVSKLLNLTNLKLLHLNIDRCLSKSSFEAISSSPCLEEVEMRVQRNATTDADMKLLEQNFEIIPDKRRSGTWFIAVELKRRSVST